MALDGGAVGCTGKRTAKLALLAISLVVSFVLAEIVLRLHYKWSFSGTLAELGRERPVPGTEVTLGEALAISEYPRLVYRFKPHLDVVYKGAALRTNALGFREETLPDSGPAPETRPIRLVGLGDSVMFGQGVEEGERYLDVLEELLQGHFPSARWQTIALAVPGYNLVTEVEALERYGLDYEPDLLIYGFVNNDLCLPNFVGRHLDVFGFESFLAHYLTLRERPLLTDRRYATLETEDRPDQELRRIRGLFERTYCSPENVDSEFRDLVGEASFRRALERLAKIGRELDVTTIFLGYGRARVDPDLQLPPGIVAIDLSGVYRAYLTDHGYSSPLVSDLVLSAEDPHPSVTGHRLIAEALFERLVEHGWVARLLERAGRD